MHSVLIVDDHPIFRKGLRSAMEDSGDFGPVREAASGAEALACMRDAQSDLVMLDLGLPDLSGFEIADRLGASFPRSKLFILSMHGDRRFARKAILSGASGYATKSLELATLIQGLRLVMLDQCFVEAELFRDLMTAQSGIAQAAETERSAG